MQDFCPFKSYRYEDSLIYCTSQCALYIDDQYKCAFVAKVKQDLEIKQELEQIKRELKNINRG